MRYAWSFIRRVCKIAGQPSWVDDLRHEAVEAGLITAIETSDTPIIFDWLMDILSYQGISDAVASGFMQRHGNVTWQQIDRALKNGADCPKLVGYWTFSRCSYHKMSQTCGEPDHFPACPLPGHPLRNGRLNQTAYSLFLFIRDVADANIVEWIDRAMRPHIACGNLAAGRRALVDPLRHVYGVSDKVVTMALATLLMGGGATRPGWFDVGTGFVVIDTLVHNFLARTGMLTRLDADHAYGPACYQPGGCADVVERVCSGIDARQFNPDFPKTFPGFVQHSIWRYCAQAGLDICNGNQIDDRDRCMNMWCRVYSECDRLSLRASHKKR
jgi:hypothetical protein